MERASSLTETKPCTAQQCFMHSSTSLLPLYGTQCRTSKAAHWATAWARCRGAGTHPYSWAAMVGMAVQGWPVHMEGFDIKNGQEVRVTADEKAEASSLVLPISYPHFAHMCQPGDTLFVGRYLVNGADQSSLYLEVRQQSLSMAQPCVASLLVLLSAPPQSPCV